MAAITDKDIYKGKSNPFDDVTKGAEVLIEEMKTIITLGKDLSKSLKVDIGKNQKQNAEDLKRLTEQTNKLGKVTKAGNEISKEKERLEKTLKKLNSDKIQQNEKLKVQIQAQRKTNKELARDQLKLVGAFEKLTKQTNAAQKRFKDLATQFGANSKQAREAKKQFEQLDNRLVKVNKAARDGRRDVGRYAKGWQGLKKLFVGGLGILGVTAGFSAIRTGITNMVRTFSEFEKQVSKVGAISGASGDDLKALTSQAQALGEATEKTASEVAQLQLELAKLGFDPTQIQDATDAILDLSTAIDSDLAESAKVVGNVLRAFDLEAEETARVTDVMAAAFSRSSLDIQKFSTAMSTVAPVAKAFGFSLEETTALLAQLTDAGFDASAAGTATRNILLNLADTNGELAKRLGGSVDNLDDLLDGLSKLNDEGVDLNETLELTDKRSVAAFNRFITATEQTRSLTKELENAEGAAARMARIMRDNLAGDADKARSAVQGLFINLGNRLNPALRKVTQSFTRLVGKLNDFTKIQASEELRRERGELNALVNTITSANNSQESRNRLLTELQDKYPDFLENIDKETISNEELRDRLKEVNAEYQEKINQLARQELITQNQEKLVDLQLEELDLVKRLDTAQDNLTFAKKQTAIATDATISAFVSAQGTVNKYTNALEKNRRQQEFLAGQLEKDIELLGELQEKESELAGTLEENTENLNEVTKDFENTLESLSKQLSNLEKEKSQINLADTESLILKQQEINAIKDQISLYNALFKLLSEKPEDIDLDFTDQLEFDADGADVFRELEELRTKELAEQLAIREDLYNKHFNSIIGIAFNFASRKAAQDQTLSADELQRLISDNEQKEAAYQQLADTLINIGNSVLQSRLDQIDQQIDARNQQINEQEQAVNRELQLLRDGAANEFETEKAKLEALQKQREQDLAKRREIQKQQQTINTLTQISELATAVATIINSAVSELGWAGIVAGLAAAAAAIIGFSTLKSEGEAAATAEEGGTFTRKGSYIEKGNRHSKGGNKYKVLKTERDEMHSVLSRKATKKYGGFMQEITDAANAGTLNADQMEMYNYSLSQLSPGVTVINNNYNDLLYEMRNVSMLLSSQKQVLFDPKGKFRMYDNYGTLKKGDI